MNLPTLNEQKKPSNPQLWKSIRDKYKQASRGGEAGKWTPRKMALAQRRYEKEGGKWEKKGGADMSISEASPNYILEAREYVMEAMPDGPEGWSEGENSRLIDLYALLALTEGESVTAEQVHDAWAAWRNHTKSDHKSIVPFDQLTADVKKMDEPYVEAIKSAARKLKQSANEFAE